MLNLHCVVDSKAQQDNSNMQIQSPGTEIGQHHGEAIRENELRRICLCVEIIKSNLWNDLEKVYLQLFWLLSNQCLPFAFVSVIAETTIKTF